MRKSDYIQCLGVLADSLCSAINGCALSADAANDLAKRARQLHHR